MASSPTSADIGGERQAADIGESPPSDDDVIDAAADASSVGDAEDMSPLAVAERERDEFLEALRRLQADFENYRKRVVRQQEEQADRVATSVIEKILPALDALDLAILHLGSLSDESPESPETTGAAATEALARVSSLLTNALAKEGLERIDPIGQEFDPNLHEAVAHVPTGDEGAQATDDAPEKEAGSPTGPTVSEVLRVGYQWKGRVLRPAMVNVEG